MKTLILTDIAINQLYLALHCRKPALIWVLKVIISAQKYLHTADQSAVKSTCIFTDHETIRMKLREDKYRHLSEKPIYSTSHKGLKLSHG